MGQYIALTFSHHTSVVRQIDHELEELEQPTKINVVRMSETPGRKF